MAFKLTKLIKIQNEDHSASNTRTTDNDAQSVPIYTKLDETLHHNASLGVTMSRTCPIVPFYRCAVVATISEHQWELSSVVGDIQLFHVLSDTLISWSAGVRMERLWPKAVHSQIHAKQPLVGIRWVVGRWLVRASVSSVVLSSQSSFNNESTLFRHQTERTGDTCVGA